MDSVPQSPLFYKTYLENQWEPWMNWGNYGSEWVIDHVIPGMYGGDPSIDDIEARLHFTNTQPLEKITNISKGNRLREIDIEKAKQTEHGRSLLASIEKKEKN